MSSALLLTQRASLLVSVVARQWSATGVCVCVCVCVCVSMCSVYTGVGFTGGVVRVLDALTLEDVCQPFHYARDCITHIAFSHDSSYMATAVSKLPSTHTVGHMVHLSPPLPQDLDLCVTVYVAQPEGETQQPWQFLAKHKAHYKQIQSEHGTVWHKCSVCKLMYSISKMHICAPLPV